MRILWVKPGGLWPLNTGGRQRSFHIISELSHRHQVILLTTHGPGDDPEGLTAHLPKCEQVLSLPYAVSKRNSARFAMAVLRSWFSSLAVNLWRWRIPALRKEVSHLISTGKIDVCVADFLHAALNVPVDAPVPVVLFTHNVEHMIWKRLCQIESRLWRRAVLELEWRKIRRYEAQTCTRAGLTVAVSDVDREILSTNAPNASVRAVSTGVDISFFTPSGTRESAVHLVFTGSMDWYPNEDAILYFIDTVLPRIRRLVPDVLLTVVGRNPTTRLLTAAGKDGIRVTGTVDDIRPYVAEAAVYVVPLRIGGGTRLKIFEALAMGKAVVSTTVGAEGLPLIPGEHFLQADEPADFSHAVVSLIHDPERRHRLGSAGRRLVEERYSWPQVACEFETCLKEAVENHAH